MGRIEEFLLQRIKANRLRTLHPALSLQAGKITLNNKEYFDFSSNDYLGLASHPALIKASCQAIRTWGTGGRASRLLSGDTTLHQELEIKTAEFKGKESALVFNSGYQANVGIISALCHKGDVVFADRLAHASLIDGILLSKAKLVRYSHNDPHHLEQLLQKVRGKYSQALIVTESVFSMDGDIAPLSDLVKLSETYDCKLLVDEAHATGIFGNSGSGQAEGMGLVDRIDYLMGTFSKALGSFGAYLACDKKTKEYLINTSRSFIYSTALPPGVIAANLASLEVIKNEPSRRRELLKNVVGFRNSMIEHEFNVMGQTQIVPFIVGDVNRTVKLSEKLQECGYWVLPIRPPTVPTKQARLRFSLTYFHSPEVLDNLVKDLDRISQQV